MFTRFSRRILHNAFGNKFAPWLKSLVNIKSEQEVNENVPQERINMLHKTNTKYIFPRGISFVIKISYTLFPSVQKVLDF